MLALAFWTQLADKGLNGRRFQSQKQIVIIDELVCRIIPFRKRSNGITFDLAQRGGSNDGSSKTEGQATGKRA
jgi:hypothetical protein